MFRNLSLETGTTDEHLRGGFTPEHALLLDEALSFLLPEERVLVPARDDAPIGFEAAP